MKAEIYQNGPISCGIYISDELWDNYTGGIYSQVVDDAESKLNHEVSVVGYGVDEKTGVEYWIIRNTQGTNWGDMGFLYLQMHKDNLAIET
jgi:C1A family cysteine protease